MVYIWPVASVEEPMAETGCSNEDICRCIFSRLLAAFHELRKCHIIRHIIQDGGQEEHWNKTAPKHRVELVPGRNAQACRIPEGGKAPLLRLNGAVTCYFASCQIKHTVSINKLTGERWPW